MPFGLMLYRFKLYSRKHPQQLRENAAYSIHGGTLLYWIGFSETQFNVSAVSPKANLDRSVVSNLPHNSVPC